MDACFSRLHLLRWDPESAGLLECLKDIKRALGFFCSWTSLHWQGCYPKVTVSITINPFRILTLLTPLSHAADQNL